MFAPEKIIIEADKPNAQYWRDVWRFRELFSLLAWRDILVRYKQTVLGIAWAIVRPLVTIFAFVFVKWMFVGADEKEAIPYPLLISAGLLAWTFFSTVVSDVANSLVGNSGLISKVYFPRIIIPLSSTVVCFIDFLVSLFIIVVLMFWYSYVPGWQVLALPLFLILAVMVSLGIGLFFAGFNVKYRDFRYLVPFALQFGMYLSPVIYSTQDLMARTEIPQWVKTLYAFNPMVSIIDGFRWCFFGEQMMFNMLNFSVSVALCVVLLAAGIWNFRKLEGEFADVI